MTNETKQALHMYALTAQQRDTIQFVLGHYAGLLAAMPDPSLNMYKHDDLIALGKSLDHTGLDFSAMVTQFGSCEDSNAYVIAAKKHVSEGDIEVDDPAVVSNGGDDGAYVQAWIWISDEDARSAEIDGYDVTIGEDGECSIRKSVDGRAYAATLDELVNEDELVCPTSGMGNDYYHKVKRATIDKIVAWAAIVDATIPTEETVS